MAFLAQTFDRGKRLLAQHDVLARCLETRQVVRATTARRSLSNGRYGRGALMRGRFIPRLLRAEPAHLRDPERDNL